MMIKVEKNSLGQYVRKEILNEGKTELFHTLNATDLIDVLIAKGLIKEDDLK